MAPFIILTLYCSSIRQASPLIPRCHLKPHHSLPLLYFKNSKDADFIPGGHLFLWWCIDHCPGCLWIWFLHQLKKAWIAWLWPNGTFVVTALNWSLTLISFLGVVREQENPSLKSINQADILWYCLIFVGNIFPSINSPVDFCRCPIVDYSWRAHSLWFIGLAGDETLVWSQSEVCSRVMVARV